MEQKIDNFKLITENEALTVANKHLREENDRLCASNKRLRVAHHEAYTSKNRLIEENANLRESLYFAKQ